MGYKTCPYCGANLDPGEPCDCRQETAAPRSGEDGRSNDNEHSKKEEYQDE